MSFSIYFDFKIPLMSCTNYFSKYGVKELIHLKLKKPFHDTIFVLDYLTLFLHYFPISRSKNLSPHRN